MSQRFRRMFVIAASFLALVALTHGQAVGLTGRESADGLALGASRSLAAVSAFPGQASSSGYTFATSPREGDSSQQQNNGNQTQNQNGNQNQGMTGSQSQNQSQNQNQNSRGQGNEKEKAPPPKPQYLTYTVKKRSLEEQAKSGKTLAVDFKSVPVGASITVDGYFVGNTPTTAQIPVGKHLVSITKWGYESWTQELDVANGKNLSVNPKLHSDW